MMALVLAGVFERDWVDVGPLLIWARGPKSSTHVSPLVLFRPQEVSKNHFCSSPIQHHIDDLF